MTLDKTVLPFHHVQFNIEHNILVYFHVKVSALAIMALIVAIIYKLLELCFKV